MSVEAGRLVSLGTLEERPGEFIHLDVDRLLETRLLVQGTSGSGKTSVIRRLLEGTCGQLQHIVFDLEDEYATLREHHDLLLGGPGRDVPVEPGSARVLARRLLEVRASAVLNLYELRQPAQRAFVAAFIEEMMAAPRSLWHDVLVVIEESQRLAPQNGKESVSTEPIIDLMTRGRKRGYCGIVACFRISDLNKSVIAPCGNRMFGLTTLDADVKRSAYELGFAPADARRLMELPTGRFFAYGPAISKAVVTVNVTQPETKPPPRRGGVVPPPAPESLRELVEHFADLPQQAADEEREGRTIAALEREVVDLRAALAAAKRAPAAAGPSAEEFARVVARLRSVQGKLERFRDWLKFHANSEGGVLAELKLLPDSLEPAKVLERQPTAERTYARTPVRPNGRSADRPAVPALARKLDGAPVELARGPEQRILAALAWLADLGVSPAHETVVAFCAGYRPGGGAYNNPRGRLHKVGAIEYVQGSAWLAITDEGLERLVALPEVPPTRLELHRRVVARLDNPERRILEPLLDAFPDALTFEELATRSGYQAGGGAFANPRGRLRTLGLIDYPSAGHARAEAILFPGHPH